ncbi:hypothetical protein MW887_003425 [Aspergillus wentii]|nr:hypothetical protein MW887_003425 [Aspergillus wentii]
MCIAVLSTAHPDYRLIIVNNRDEFLHRPTSRADWWPNNPSILSARDLARSIHGTWLGITKQGRLAVLTNIHEPNCEQAVGICSRGEIVNSWLEGSGEKQQTTAEFVDAMMASNVMDHIGGFNLICGYVGEPLAVISNRANPRVHWIQNQPGQTVAMSNTGFEDRSWPKVIMGEKFVDEAITEQVKLGETEDEFIVRLFETFATDTLPRLSEDSLEAYLDEFPKSVFIPTIGSSKATQTGYLEGAYATQKQTVVLVGLDGRVRYVERTLYDEDANTVPGADRSFEFTVER